MRMQAKEKKKTNEMKKKKGLAGASAKDGKQSGAAQAVSAVREAPASKKQKRLVEDKKDVIAFVESIGGAVILNFHAQYILSPR